MNIYRIVCLLYWFVIQIAAVSRFEEYTKGPYLISIWDAIWMPAIISTIPMILGYFAGKED